MSYTLQQLGDLVLHELDAWGAEDILNGDITAAAASLVVTDDSARFKNSTYFEIDEEIGAVSADATTTTVSVLRGKKGSTAATHSDGALIRVSPKVYRRDINKHINTCLAGHVEQRAVDTSISLSGSTYVYNLPAAIKGEKVISIDMLDGTGSYSTYSYSNVKFRKNVSGVDQFEIGYIPEVGRTLRIVYRKNFTNLSALTDICGLPDNEQAQKLPVWYACSLLVPHKEAKRLLRDKPIYVEESPPFGVRGRTGAYYRTLFEDERSRAGLAPVRGNTFVI